MIGRLGAVDYGRKRIGLAVCDALGITVTGLETLVRTGTLDQVVAAVAGILEERDVVKVVVGLPLHADGRPSDMSREAEVFGAALGAVLGLPVVYIDEGLTSWEAEETLKSEGKRLEKARKSGAIDRVAAVSILRSYLREEEGRSASPQPED